MRSPPGQTFTSNAHHARRNGSFVRCHRQGCNAFLRPEFEELALTCNQKILYLVPSPPQYVFVKKDIATIDDFAGIPLRGADKNTVDIISAIGMNGVVMP